MTPYDVLGVNANATPEEITDAYRHLAKQYHPDRNPGDEIAAAHYARVGDAYELLKDQTRRAAYDRDGTTKAARNQHQELLSVLVPVMMSAIQQTAEWGGGLRDCDLIFKMKEKVDETLRQIEVQHTSLKRGEESLECVMGRFEGDPEDLLNQAVACQLAGLRETLSSVREEMDRQRRALAYLKNIKYRRDGSAVGGMLPNDPKNTKAKKPKMLAMELPDASPTGD